MIFLYYNNTKFILNIEKSNITDAGMGVFTYEYIKKNTLIGYYVGEVKKSKRNECVGNYSFSISKRYYIDARKSPRCYIAMINDNYNTNFKTNCEFRITMEDDNGKKLKPSERKISLWSTKNISKKSELLASYGDDYWESRK